MRAGNGVAGMHNMTTEKGQKEKCAQTGYHRKGGGAGGRRLEERQLRDIARRPRGGARLAASLV